MSPALSNKSGWHLNSGENSRLWILDRQSLPSAVLNQPKPYLARAVPQMIWTSSKKLQKMLGFFFLCFFLFCFKEKKALKYTLLPDAFSFIRPCYPQEVAPDIPCSNLLSFWPTSYYSKQKFPRLGLLFLWTIAWCKKCRCLLAATSFAEPL